MLKNFKAFKNVFRPQLSNNFVRYFGGGGGHDAPIHLDNKQNWIGNKDFSKEYVALYGWKEEHDHHHADHSDPYAAVRNAPFFSFKRMYFTDAFYVADENEPLMNLPHGYLTNDDPLDVRNSVEKPAYEYLFLTTIAIGGFLLCFTQFNLNHTSADIYNMDLTAEMIEEEIRNIRIQNSELEKKKADLLAKLEA